MKYVIGFIFLVAGLKASANYACPGKVVHLGTSGSDLWVSNGYGIHLLCSLTSDGCKAWMSLATTAKITGKSVVIYYSSSTIGGDQTTDACLKIGNWVSPKDKPYYFQLN